MRAGDNFFGFVTVRTGLLTEFAMQKSGCRLRPMANACVATKN